MNSDRIAAAALLLAACLASASPAADRPAKTWRTLDEIPAEQKKDIDLRTDTPRDPKFPYLPAERYPFEPPYTAEELGIRSTEFIHVSRWSHVIYDSFGVLTSGGYLNQGAAIGLVNYLPEPGLGGELYDIAPGDVTTRMSLFYVFPPESGGAQELYAIHRTDDKHPTKLDLFAYAPSLRRVRRQPEPRRGERYPNNVQSFDDVVGRGPWEVEWRFVGDDVLYDTIRYPNTRPKITLANADLTLHEVDTSTIKMMGDSYPHYRPDGGIDCWVVEAKTRPDWLPGYPVSKAIYWLDRHAFYPLRIEQYDQQGELQFIEVRHVRHENPALGERGYAALNTVYYDPKLDMMSYSFHDAHTLKQWTDEDREVVFSPDFMRRGWLVQPLKSQVLIRSPKEYFLRPHIDREKFPAVRKIVLSPEVEARIAAQEAAGHVVFEREPDAAETPPAR
jgi:uncharacterized protein DUF1329